MYISLSNDLIVFPVMYNKPALISGYIHGLIEGAPRGLCNNVVLRARNLFNTFSILIQSSLEIVYTHVRSLPVVIHDQELLVAQGELDVFCLDVGDGHRRSHYDLAIHGVENAEPEGRARC